MTLDSSSCGGYLFTQGNFEALVCLNTRCALYGQPQNDVDAGQMFAGRGGSYHDNDYDEDEGDDD